MHQTGREALEALKKGNEAFLNGQELSSRTPTEISDLVHIGQKNNAAVLGCADSRVKPSEIFGDCTTFSVRIAGNVPNQEAIESLIYDVEANKTRLVVVLGHTNCGAVQASINDPKFTSKNFPKVYEHIAYSVHNVEKKCCDHEALEASVIDANVQHTVEMVANEFQIRNVNHKGLLFIGGVVHLEQGGKVDWFENQVIEF